MQVEQISAEFKVRALKYHPDKNAGDKKAEETFQKLNVSNATAFAPRLTPYTILFCVLITFFPR